MEEKLKQLFEFQRFSPDKRLSQMIADVRFRYGQLSDEALELVAAAGEPTFAEERDWDDPFQ